MARPGGLWLDPDDLDVVRAGLAQAQQLIGQVAQQIGEASGSVHLDHPATHVLGTALVLAARSDPVTEIQRAIAHTLGGSVSSDGQPVAKLAFEALVAACTTAEWLRERGVLRVEDQDRFNQIMQAKALELARRFHE
jgi:hypothetical protein